MQVAPPSVRRIGEVRAGVSRLIKMPNPNLLITRPAKVTRRGYQPAADTKQIEGREGSSVSPAPATPWTHRGLYDETLGSARDLPR